MKKDSGFEAEMANDGDGTETSKSSPSQYFLFELLFRRIAKFNIIYQMFEIFNTSFCFYLASTFFIFSIHSLKVNYFSKMFQNNTKV
jgi:hypothetical protein